MPAAEAEETADETTPVVLEMKSQGGGASEWQSPSLGVYRLLPVEVNSGLVYRQLHDGGEGANYIHR